MREFGWLWRTIVSIISGIGWLIFLVAWLFFYAEYYSIYQNIGIFIISLLVVGLINAVTWVSAGKGYKTRHSSGCR